MEYVGSEGSMVGGQERAIRWVCGVGKEIWEYKVDGL